jgi:predicted nucleotidyltransferase
MTSSTAPRLTLEQITATLRLELPELRREYGVKSLGVFGSYVNADPGADSDVDLLVDFEQGTRMTLFRFVGLQEHLAELLGTKVDLVMRSALKPAIGERILAEVVPV